MAKDDFTFHHLETPEDIEENLEIMRKVFGSNTGVDLFVKKLIYKNPRMKLENYFVIKHRGKMVATLNLIPMEWKIDGVSLKVAEMGCVATLESYRCQGLMRKLINEYHKAIADQWYDLSAIEGIPYFYRQFGYEYTLPLDEETKISLEKLPQCTSEHVIRPFTDKDIPKAINLLSQAQEKFYVRSVRDEQAWRMQQETRMASEYGFEPYAVEKDGEMTAYFRISHKTQSKELVLREISDTDYSTNNAVLGFIKGIGRKSGHETLVARTSYCDPLTRILVTLGAEQRIPPYAWQIKVTDYVNLLQKMKPILEARIKSSEYRGLNEKINFNLWRYVVQIVFENGEIASVQKLNIVEEYTVGANPLVLMKLLLGYRSRQELESCYPDFYVRAKYKQLINVLFPQLPSYIHSAY